MSRGVFYSRWGNTFSQIWDSDSLWMFENVMVTVQSLLVLNSTRVSNHYYGMPVFPVLLCMLRTVLLQHGFRGIVHVDLGMLILVR